MDIPHPRSEDGSRIEPKSVPAVRRRLAHAWLLSLLPVLVAAAAPANPTNPNFSLRGWQVEEGLPQNSVTAIAQTRDGYLWVGTYGGLARFDGESFQIFSALNIPNLQDDDIVSLYEDEKRTLWIGHESGAVTYYRNGQFEKMALGVATASRKVAAISADSSGNIWLLRDDGSLQSGTDGRVLPKPANHSVGALGLVRDAAGELFVNRGGQVSRIREGKLEPIDFGQATSSGYVLGFASAADGGLWVVRDGRLKKWTSGRWTEDRGQCSFNDSYIPAMTEMLDGSVAIGTNDKGYFLISPNGQVSHFEQSNGLPQNWVRAFCKDREGDLWVGIGTGGLVMMKPTLFTVTNAPDQWQGHTVLSVAPGRGAALWIGSEGAGLYRYMRGEWTHYGQEHGLWNPYVWSVAEDVDGRVWVGTWGGGLYQLREDRFSPVPGFPTGNAPILALECTPEDHGLWAGVGNGLVHWRDGVTTWAFKAGAGATNNISAVVRDQSGVIWFGITGGGLGRLAGGRVSLFHRSDGLASDRVNCLLPEGDGTLWIGTADAGLSRLKGGRFSTIGESQGLPSNVICHIADDSGGFIWLSTHHGILRFAKDELNRCADGHAHSVAGQVYEREDGLPTLEFSGGLKAAGCNTSDGRLWFTSSKGLVSVNPTEVRPNRIPPPVILESVQVDGRIFDNVSKAIDGLKLAPSHMRLEFRYAALSFAAPSKVRFKYRLLGLDSDWIDAGNKRSAAYSQLAPGSYRFQCIASNGYGIWNLKGAELAFTVLPFYWQTWWFLGISGLFTLLVTAWAVRFETRRRMQRRFAVLEQERAIELERTRIARDIHDDIGANLTRITLLSQSAPNGSSQPAEASAILQEISGTAREVTQSLDEIVWAVNPKHDTFESLICYMAKFAQDFLNAAHVRFRLDIPNKVPDWPLSTHTRHNLFLAFKEVLNNTVKHSEASEVRLSLSVDPNSLVLTIGDNGRGMPIPAEPYGAICGNGIPNLQHRLAQIGGRYEVVTNSEKGTTVLFTISKIHRTRNGLGHKSRP